MTVDTCSPPSLETLPWSRSGHLEIACKPELVAIARHFTRDLIAGCLDNEDLVDEVVLLVSELVTNAVQYAASAGPPAAGVRPGVGLGVECSARYVRVCVRDPYPVLPRPRTATEDAESGRGLREIVEAYADAWWVHLRPDDKAIHVVLLRPGEVLLQGDLVRFAGTQAPQEAPAARPPGWSQAAR
ncbi:ATP-binding protein [Actinomadura sp. DC4]|uniref:ATP-binding protein n=1 Tax=Actinomadura sp. DC4 TaxID=3055069 RepID=UPI0025B078C3|nr:ATP-binding protein [Actinomadura sp. DC4]MDN3356102.1 ATP-binding protein [Actinomadura sp. DC4]